METNFPTNVTFACQKQECLMPIHTKTRFNLKRHLSSLHGQKEVEAFENKIKKKKPSEISGGSAGLVQVLIAKYSLVNLLQNNSL